METQGFDFNTAVELAKDMRKRRKGADDLNDRGRSLLQGLESELRRRGFASFRDYESKERERVGRNEGLRRSVVSGRERSQALGIEAQAEDDTDEKTKIEKQSRRAGRAADITEGILARRTALSPQQGMPTQAPPGPRQAGLLQKAGDFVARQGRYLVTPQEGIIEPINPTRPTRAPGVVHLANTLLKTGLEGYMTGGGQLGARTADRVVGEVGRRALAPVAGALRRGPAPLRAEIPAPSTPKPAARPPMKALPARAGGSVESIPRPMPSRTAPGPSGLEGQNIRDVLLYRHQMVSPQTQRSYRGASVEELNETAKQGQLVRSRRLDPRGEFVTWTTRDPEEALRYSLDPHYGRDVASHQTGAIIESDQHGKFIRGFVVNPAGQIESVVTPGGQARPLSPRGQAGRVPQPPPPAQFSRMRVSQPKPKTVPVVPTVDNPPKVVFPIGGGAEKRRASVMHTTPTIINRVTGTNLGSEMLQVRSLEEPLAGTRNVALRQAELLRLSPQEDANLLRTLRGREAPATPRVARIAQEFRAMTEEDASDYLARGAQVMDQPQFNPATGQLEPTYRPFVPRQNYAPESVDSTRVAKMSVQKLQQSILRANPQMPPQVAADIAVGLRARALGEEAVGISAEATRMLRAGRSTPSHLHARVEFELPEEILRPMRESIPHYIHDSARERAMLQVYGPADERVRSALNQAAQSGHPDAKLAIEAWNRFRGITQDSPVTEKVGQIGRILGNSASAMFLGIPTAVKQFTQAAPVLANLPTRKVALGFVKAFTREGRYEAERAGAVIDDLLRDAVQSRAALPTATSLDRLERFTGRVALEVVRRSGISRSDSFLRTATFHAAQSELTSLRDAAFNGSRGALKKLQREGLSATSTTDDITRTAKRLADELNLRAGNLDMPYALTTPGYAFARQLNSFTIGMTGMINKRYLMPLVAAGRHLVKRKDPRPLAEAVANIGKLTIAGTVVGEAVESALQALQGRKEDRAGGTLGEFIEGIQAGRVPSGVVIARMKDDLATAALLGYLQTINEAMKSYNPEARLYGAAAGAGVSNVAEIESLTRNLVTAPAGKQRDRAQRQALRGAVRRVPGVGGVLAPRLFPPKN